MLWLSSVRIIVYTSTFERKLTCAVDKAELEETLVKQVEAHVLSKLGWMNAELLLGAKENVSKNVAAVPEVDIAETVEATKLWVQERTAKIEEAKAAMHALDEAQRKNNSTEVEAIRTRIQELQFELNQSLGGGKQKSLIEAPEGQVANLFSAGPSGEASSNGRLYLLSLLQICKTANRSRDKRLRTSSSNRRFCIKLKAIPADRCDAGVYR